MQNFWMRTSRFGRNGTAQTNKKGLAISRKSLMFNQ
jgi:hypothetical protein